LYIDGYNLFAITAIVSFLQFIKIKKWSSITLRNFVVVITMKHLSKEFFIIDTINLKFESNGLRERTPHSAVIAVGWINKKQQWVEWCKDTLK
jgi:hypothetical protein